MSWLGRASRQVVRQIQPLVPRQSGGVTILAYHLVGAATRSVVDLPIEVFRAQLSELLECAEVVSLAQAVRHLESGRDDARSLVVVTFDDAFDNFRTRAWPVLQELEIPSTLYVPVGFIERTSGSPLRGADELRPMEWGALRDLAADRLMTIGSHSWRHRDLRQLSITELRDDLRRSRERLEDRTSMAVEHFCYPQAKWSPAVEKEVRAVYRTGVLAGGRRNVGRSFCPHRLWRTPIRQDMPQRMAPVIQPAVWLEEWAASHVRAFR